MRITVNGVVLDNPERLDVLVEVDPGGEVLHGMDVEVRGGRLVIRGQYYGIRMVAQGFPAPAIVLESESQGYLIGDRNEDVRPDCVTEGGR